MFGILLNIILTLALGALGYFLIYLALSAVVYLGYLFFTTMFSTPIPMVIFVIMGVVIIFYYGVVVFNWIFKRI